jgi:hypothetical protein
VTGSELYISQWTTREGNRPDCKSPRDDDGGRKEAVLAAYQITSKGLHGTEFTKTKCDMK